MSPPSSDSLSDGEIVSGDEEKANHTTDRNSKDNVVNTSIRLPHPGASSRAAQLGGSRGDDQRSHARQGDNNGRRSLERSRSPYRRGKSRSRSPYRSSGEKRKHGDDHYGRKTSSDPRRFKIHYEENGPGRGRGREPNVTYSEPDRPRNSKRDLDHPSREVVNREERHESHRRHGSERARSRSPYRPGRDRSDERARDTQDRVRQDTRGAGIGKVTSSQSKNIVITEKLPKSEPGKSQLPSNGESGGGPTRLVQHLCSQSEPAHSFVHRIVGSSIDSVETDMPESILSEAELIEQRRKRREAIKARHKTAQPLLVQALEQNLTPAPATPVHDSSPDSSAQQSPPSSFNSPRTPQHDSLPGSPVAFVVSDDEDLLNPRQTETIVGDEGPSAADYDPNMDMQEDRPDHKKQDIPTDSNWGNDENIESAQVAPEQNKVYDMFADDVDDDDDMFAPMNTTRNAAPTATKQGRALEQSLLDNWDYPDGHYRILLGELLDGRYAVQQQIGKGTFATVVRATDTRDGSAVAVKIACNNDTMYKAGQKEMDMLNLLNQNDPEDKKHIIRLVRQFEHKGHLCLVFENLSADLREVLKKFGRNVGLNLKAIRSYAQQMFLALGHMKKCQILHADLKPDNILVSDKRNLLKVCDLGTASFADDVETTPYLVSRFYRAPEVILGMPFDYAIDMWSIGCTLFELYTGRILFAGADNNQMLRSIQESRGKFPLRMLKRASLLDKHFDAAGNFYSQERDKITGKPTVRPMNFNKTVPGKDLRARLSSNLKGMRAEEIKEHASFVDLMEKCLQLDPARRISPNEALRHSFVTHVVAGVAPQGEKIKEPVKIAMSLPRLK